MNSSSTPNGVESKNNEPTFEYIDTVAKNLPDEQLLDCFLRITSPQTKIHAYRVLGKKLSASSIHKLINKTCNAAHHFHRPDFSEAHSIVSFCELNYDHTSKLLAFYSENPKASMLIEQILNTQKDISAEWLYKLAEHQAPTIRILTTLHFAAETELAVKIWNEDPTIRSGVLYSNKIPLDLIVTEFFGNENVSSKKDMWNMLKKVHEKRSRWKENLSTVLSPYISEVNLENVPLEWIYQMINIFIFKDEENE